MFIYTFPSGPDIYFSLDIWYSLMEVEVLSKDCAFEKQTKKMKEKNRVLLRIMLVTIKIL